MCHRIVGLRIDTTVLKEALETVIPIKRHEGFKVIIAQLVYQNVDTDLRQTVCLSRQSSRPATTTAGSVRIGRRRLWVWYVCCQTLFILFNHCISYEREGGGYSSCFAQRNAAELYIKYQPAQSLLFIVAHSCLCLPNCAAIRVDANSVPTRLPTSHRRAPAPVAA